MVRNSQIVSRRPQQQILLPQYATNKNVSPKPSNAFGNRNLTLTYSWNGELDLLFNLKEREKKH